MGRYLLEGDSLWMRTCDSCGGAWRCAPPENSGASPGWTCGTCQHVSDLEKSLENARKERDDEHDQLVDALSRERSMAATERLALQERDAALADNAEILDLLLTVKSHFAGGVTSKWPPDLARRMAAAAASPHPGAALREREATLRRELEMVRAGELCPHEMPLQRIAQAVSKPGETLSAHDVADRALERVKRLEEERAVLVLLVADTFRRTAFASWAGVEKSLLLRMEDVLAHY
jgi:hypothetical protein